MGGEGVDAVCSSVGVHIPGFVVSVVRHTQTFAEGLTCPYALQIRQGSDPYCCLYKF